VSGVNEHEESGAPITVTREGSRFRLTFGFDLELVAAARSLPASAFDGSTKTWSCPVSTQAVNIMRGWHYRGLTNVVVDALLGDDEQVPTLAGATLRAGTARRPFVVELNVRSDGVFNALKTITGASWDKNASAMTFPPRAAIALGDLVTTGVIADPDAILNPHETMVGFDTRTGSFVVRGPDARAGVAFDKHFPATDVVAAWADKGLDVGFTDDFTVEMYAGERARVGPGHQPDDFGIELYPYQKNHVAVALARTGYGVWDQPGLGKPAPAVAVGLELLRRGSVGRVIAMVPAAIRSQWVAEIIRFTGCSPDDVVVVDGDPRSRDASYAAAATAPWMVIHYDILARDLAKLKPLFSGALVIADEAQRLKTYNSQRTIAATTLAKLASRRLALTGTPTERNVEEFYQVLSGFTVPSCLGGPVDFKTRYMFKSRFGFEGARNIPELRARTFRYYGRFTKAQVAAHLPPLRVQQVILDPTPAYAAALRRAHGEAAKELKDAARGKLTHRRGGTLLDGVEADEVSTGAEMTAVGMLRLMCSSPRLVAGSTSDAAEVLRNAGIVPDEDGPKLDELRIMVAEMQAAQDARKERMAADNVTTVTPEMVHGERVVVFTFSRKMADLIATRLTEDGIKHVLFTGTTSSTERDAAVAAFTDPTSDVIAFIATDAAAEGLNLGKCCCTLIQLDLPWSPARAEQRGNRIHRLDGTATRYLVINFVIAGTMELGVSRLLEQRADLSDALLGETGGRHKIVGRRSGRVSLLEEAMTLYGGTNEAHRAGPSGARGASPPKPHPAPNSVAGPAVGAADFEPPPEDGDVEHLPAALADLRPGPLGQLSLLDDDQVVRGA